MRKRFAMMRSNDSGFTLVELLIVIVILGVLTGIVVFSVGAFSDRGETAACKADKKTVEVAVEAYRAKTGAYPQSALVNATDASNERYTFLINAADPTLSYLREKPPTDKYQITISGNKGEVSSAGC